MLGEIPHWCCAQRGWLLSLWEFQACFSALNDSFLLRKRLRPSRPPVFFLPVTCEEKTAGQRIWAASDYRAHVGSVPARLAFTERAFTCPLHPTRSASLRGCERCYLVRCERQRNGWQPFSGGFRCGRVIGLRGWPRPLAVICFTERQTESGWRTHPRDDEGCQWARARMVSDWGTIPQQVGRVVFTRVPSGSAPMLIPLLPRSARRAHKILAHALFVSHPPLFFNRSLLPLFSSSKVINTTYFTV